MKAVILAGGFGTRLSEETTIRPKPMVEIGGRPILWHILKLYSHHGINDFIICCGYKGYMIKEYFANYFLHMSDVTFDMQKRSMEVHQSVAEPWRVTLVDTGDQTATAGRLKRVAHFLEGDDAFCMTYGDGVSDVDISASIAFHRQHGARVTITAVQPPARFGALGMDGTVITTFQEKPQGEGGDSVEIKRVSQRVGKEYGSCPLAKRPLKLTRVDLVTRNGHVHKNWHQTILKNRIYCRRKTCGNSNDLIPRLQLPIAQFWRSQSAERNEIGRRTGVDERCGTDTNKPRKIPFKGFREPTRGKPRVESRIYHCAHVRTVYHFAGYRNR